jgi:hypothetical protein
MILLNTLPSNVYLNLTAIDKNVFKVFAKQIITLVFIPYFM